MLEQIRDELEILICINAKDLERHKMRADLGISYEDDVLRLVDVFRDRGFLVEHVVITQMEDDNRLAVAFVERLQRLGLKVARHRVIPDTQPIGFNRLPRRIRPQRICRKPPVTWWS